MTAARERLPDRRACESFTFEVGGLTYTATISRYADGRVGELFLGNHKSNSTADTNARNSAIAFHSQFNMAPMPKRSAAPYAVTAQAARSVPWPRHSTS